LRNVMEILINRQIKSLAWHSLAVLSGGKVIRQIQQETRKHFKFSAVNKIIC
jgi:hypothetical protein